MRISLVAVGRYCNDPRARTLASSLARVGHDVVVIASGRQADCEADGIAVQFVATRYPQGKGRFGKILRRLQTRGMRRRMHHSRLEAAVRATKPDIIYPTSEAAVVIAAAAATGTNATVARDPRWVNAGPRDLVKLAPHHPELNVSPAGPGGPYMTPADQRAANTPEPGRHRHIRIALCFRKTDTNPGKYLETAMVRAGITVDLHTDEIDWRTIPADTNAVLFVEGPYPALTVKGRNPGIPVVYWVHHGEHHIPTNLRLVERYGAHTVLLAHSWHLAHRFPVPVHRFTFGVAPELVDATIPWVERKYAASMVGGQLRRKGGTYARRQQLVDDLEEAFGRKETAFMSDVSAQEMATIYGDAKTIINEGGTRHYPITMRVLEAIGSGAILITDDLAGTDLIVKRDHYFVLEDDVAAQVRRILDQPERMTLLADEARHYALGHHTYDHRVDDLVDVIGNLEMPEVAAEPPLLSAMAALIDADVEVQRLAQFGLPELGGELRSREVWDGEERIERLHAETMEAVAIGPEGTRHLNRALQAARRYIYAAGDLQSIEKYVMRELPDATCTRHGDLLRVDLNAESYRILPHERTITT
ncbi:MAG: glycosyltransferase [Actinomycetota bacterium]|nr:glycosyltransferase [Actinomycetota bacterium]